MMAVDDICYGPDWQPWRKTISEVAVTKNGEFLVSAPTSDPLSLDSYPEIAGVTSHWYQLLSSGLSPEQRQRALDETSKHISDSSKLCLGTSTRLSFNADPLKDMADCLPLTGGDPFKDGPCDLNMKWMERNVLDYFASLWRAKWPHNPADPDSYWGYVATLDTAETTAYCLQSARDYLSGKFVVQAAKPFSCDTSLSDPRQVDKYIQGELVMCNPAHAKSLSPVVFFSSEAHHSVARSAHFVDIPTFYQIGTKLYPSESPLGNEWPTSVPCVERGEGQGNVDVLALGQLVDFFSGKGHPIIVLFNYGSSFMGVCDDVQAAGENLIPILKKNGMYEQTYLVTHVGESFRVSRKGFWFHVDGSLASLYMPFYEMAYQKGLILETPGPTFDFCLDFVTSLATNTHNWIGSPWPCSVFMTRVSNQLRASTSLVSHFGFFDSVLSGARYAFSMLNLWSQLSDASYDKQVGRVVEGLTSVQEVMQKFLAVEKKAGLDLWVQRSPHSFIILFRKPKSWIVKKYSLECKELLIQGEHREYARLCLINGQAVDLLLDDLSKIESFI